MKNRSWYIISLFNLAIVALLGSTLRSKILFSLPWIDHKNLINAHSHFAFGAWISLSFLTMFTEQILPEDKGSRPWYGKMLWGLQISSVGMLLSFPFQGYGAISIFFSTLFILFSYGFAWAFIRDMYASGRKGPDISLSIAAVLCLVISSAGPFTLAYVLASHSSNSFLYKDAVYFYLHFQYNGFFTLSVFSLLISRLPYKKSDRTVSSFASLLWMSIIPSFFLTLLWHPGSIVLRVFAMIGVGLLAGLLFFFFRFIRLHPAKEILKDRLALLLCRLVFISFVIKTVLQAGTSVPDLANAVFGLRPIIIGFLHLVFLGLASFYILSEYIQRGVLNTSSLLTRVAITGFMGAVVVQETVLLIQGTGLLMGKSDPAFNWILWILSVLLFLFATLMGASSSKTVLLPRHEH